MTPPVLTVTDRSAIARLGEDYQAAYFQILFLARTRKLPAEEQAYLREIKAGIENLVDESRDARFSIASDLYGDIYLQTPLSDYKTLLYYSRLFRELEISLVKHRAFKALDNDPTRVESALYGKADILFHMQNQATAAEWFYFHHLPEALRGNSFNARLYLNLSLAHLALPDYIRSQHHRGVFGRPEVGLLVNIYLKHGLPKMVEPILDDHCANYLRSAMIRARD